MLFIILQNTMRVFPLPQLLLDSLVLCSRLLPVERESSMVKQAATTVTQLEDRDMCGSRNTLFNVMIIFCPGIMCIISVVYIMSVLSIDVSSNHVV